MFLHMVAEMEVQMVANIEVDKVADMVADNKKKNDIDIYINMEIQFGERVGHRDWLSGTKLFRPEACASSKLCEFSSSKGMRGIRVKRL